MEVYGRTQRKDHEEERMHVNLITALDEVEEKEEEEEDDEG
ncbi:cell cycle control protein [Aspergillus luchuensis]|uniref:Cell cycle control protein n=1 Tax=Aspergillus kawachii TaxID=1069201 RepID=A0A146FD79_ASPKA|nr:cell cycle control protein [Aspergillus luchuensis]